MSAHSPAWIRRGRDRESRSRGVLAVFLPVVLLVVATLLAGGCGVSGGVGDAGPVADITSTTVDPGSGTATTVTTTPPGTTTTETPADTITLSVYFAQVDETIRPLHRVLPATQEVGAAAVQALLEGPTAAEEQAGFSSSIPAGTTFLGLAVASGVATVDLSQEYASGGGSLSMAVRLAQVVFTLTQFPTIDSVSFKLDGEPVDVFGGEGIVLDHPVSRSDYEELSPAVLVESPAFEDEVRSPVRIWGTANVFEAVFHVEVVEVGGRVIAAERVMATSGTGERGDFDVTAPFTVDQEGFGVLKVFVYSAKDGSRSDVVEIPLYLSR